MHVSGIYIHLFRLEKKNMHATHFVTPHNSLFQQEVVTISVPAPSEPHRTLAVVGILARLTPEGITELQANKHAPTSGVQVGDIYIYIYIYIYYV